MRPDPASTLPVAMDSSHAGQDTGQAYNWGLILAILAHLAFWALVAIVVMVWA